MLEFLTGSGLAAAAGMNAYIPLLAIGIANRFFANVIQLPEGWAWLSNEWVLIILGVLLVIEFLADKIPAVDTVNDVVQTVVRPTAGGLAFGSSSTATTTLVTDPVEFFQSHQWVPIAIGVVIALCVHVPKMAMRPAANTLTGGTAAPVLSFFEDVSSVTMSIFAIVMPVLVILGFGVLIWIFIAMWRRYRGKNRTPVDERDVLASP